MHDGLLSRDASVLVVVDVQERLAPVIHGREGLLARVELLVAAAGLLGVPVLVSEQYPQGLGRTVEAVRRALPAGTIPVEKTEFSCAPVPEFAARLAALGRTQVVLAGMETHVCVAQTALDLRSRDGGSVWVAADATGSRRPEDARIALERLRAAGVGITTAEAVVFEWLRRAGTPEFKAMQARLKALA